MKFGICNILSLSVITAGFLYGCDYPEEEPDIVLILADDMGFSDIGCYGGEINTPNIDKLAKNGVRFTQFYNNARCCPSRASLLTGLYPHQAGLGNMAGWKTDSPGYTGELNNSCVTIAEVLKAGGYNTYMSGKWHVANSVDGSDKHDWPLNRGFERFFGTIRGGGDYYNPLGLISNNDFIEADSNFYYTDRIAQNAQRFVSEHNLARKDNPFFLYVAFTSPHWPLQAPDSMIRKYSGKYNGGWDSLRVKRLNRQIELGVFPEGYTLSARDTNAPAWDTVADKTWQRRRMEVYAAQVEAMDRGIGKIIETIESTGRSNKTIIIFLSDNGGCAEKLESGTKNQLVKLLGNTKTRYGQPIDFCSDPTIMPGSETTIQSVGIGWANAQNTPFRLFKHYVHEGGISTPLILQWPDKIKKRGELINHPGMLMDIMATCISVSGTHYPERFNGNKTIPVEGYDLMPLIIQGEKTKREAMYWEHEGNRAIRQGPWKLVSIQKTRKWELYNIDNDRNESSDLSEKYPDIVKELSHKWEEWALKSNVLPN